MESALYGVYTLVVLYQKSHSFASLTCSISDTPQLVCKHRTHALSMKYSIYLSTFKNLVKAKFRTEKYIATKNNQSGIVISFDNLDQNKSLTNRCTSFRSRDIIW